MTYSSSAPPGWYPDPQAGGAPGAERYWDGAQWTQMVRNTAFPTPLGAPPGIPLGYGYGTMPVATKTNTCAILSLVFSCLGVVTYGVASIAGVVLGHVARAQINRSGGRESGSGLALAGLIVGYVMIVLVAVIVVAVIAAFNSEGWQS